MMFKNIKIFGSIILDFLRVQIKHCFLVKGFVESVIHKWFWTFWKLWLLFQFFQEEHLDKTHLDA